MTAATELIRRPEPIMAPASRARIVAANAVVVLVLCAGTGSASLVGVMFALVASIGGIAVARPRLRGKLERYVRYRARVRRETRRRRTLAPTGPLREQQYCDLRDLVHEIERTDPHEATRLELQELLDFFVTVASTHQRCLDARRLARTHDATGPCDPSRSRRRLEIIARRRQLDDECARRAERLADEVDAIDELVRLIAQRVSCARQVSDVDGELDRRLSDLDAIDAAVCSLDTMVSGAEVASDDPGR